MISSQTTILLAEDEVNDVFLMQRALKKARLTTPLRTVSDGEEAISYLSGEEPYSDRKKFPIPALLLLDLKLPRRTGLEVLAWVREQRNGLHRLPVVILTSSRQSVDVNRAYDLGANSYLVKPVNFQGLLELIQTFEKYWLVYSQVPEIEGG